MKISAKAVKAHFRKELDQAHIQIDELSNQRAQQSRILNTIRELLITRTEWNGIFHKGEDLSTILLEVLETGNARPRGIT